MDNTEVDKELAAEEQSSDTPWFRVANRLPSKRLKAALDASNASYSAFGTLPTAPQPRFVDKNLTIAGLTRMGGPLRGISLIAGKENTDEELQDKVNTVAHEATHSRSAFFPEKPPETKAQQQARQRLADLMEKYQSLKAHKPYWGRLISKNRARDPEEQTASIMGYEGSLPKGTSLTSTPLGKDMDQDMKDVYYSRSSVPHGGLWEGQVPEPTYKSYAIELLNKLFSHVGLGHRLTH